MPSPPIRLGIVPRPARARAELALTWCRQAVEQGGIELEGLAVGVDIGAREARPQQRRSDARGGAEQLVDLAVLETAQLARPGAAAR